ncbi:MAG: isoprenylcysteine carboxylmethyltransferase family protein [Hyphomicrobium sp.]
MMTDLNNKAAAASDRANTFPWPPVLLVLAIAGALALGHLAPLAWPGTGDTPARMVGLGAGARGLALITAGVLTLRRHETTVMPDKAATELVTTGPYRFFRNPIYLGDAMTLFGIAELTRNIWFVAAAALFAVLVTWLQILPEERHLEARFGEAYRDYKTRARRWI